MKMRKVPGFNDIPAELIKNTGQSVVKCFLYLLNKIWKTQLWPDVPKIIFTPLPRKGDVTECTNIGLTAASVVHHKRKNAGLYKTRDFWGIDGLLKRAMECMVK